MTRESLIEKFDENHQAVIAYISELSEAAFLYSNQGKWTAGQQLGHLYLCLKPIAQALASKAYILQKFGRIDRPAMTYEQIVDRYKAALDKGGKAPDLFLPEPVDAAGKPGLTAGLSALLQTIRQLLGSYAEEELDTLVLPHPLLGKLTIRELMYLMTYHATHHHRQAERNLVGYGGNGG